MRALLDAGQGYFAGLLRGAARRRGIRIFRYHGVVEKCTDPLLERNQHLVASFSSQMAYLKRFHVLGMEELLEALERPSTLREPAAVVTFDDGFANNLTVADVMSHHRLPWCLFASTGEIGDDHAMWLNEFSMLMLAGQAPCVEALGGLWPLGTREERERAFTQLRPSLKALPAAAKSEAMSAIRAQFPVEESRRLVGQFPSLRMLNWSELQQLSASGVEIGSHGVHHDLHHADQPARERRRELSESRREIEARLRRSCRAFAFPNGKYVTESPAEVADAGYAAAFTTESGSVGPEASRYLLPRLAAPQSLRRFVHAHRWEDPPAQERVVVMAKG